MIDTNKLLAGLGACSGRECAGRVCPYFHDVLADAFRDCDCTTELVRDALALIIQIMPNPQTSADLKE